ncbi:MAG: AAA family ATPase, partial [Gammaproteobacteria bacterium]|nr:AAA family ATPase [Gammaproteobacteria bacterium]
MPQLDRLGLTTNPFQNTTEQSYFYADQNREQILESTQHLINYSSNFQVIIGESGVGKSHLLEAISDRVDNNWQIAKIKNADQYDTLSLIQAILDGFGYTGNDDSELLEALETLLAEINQLGFKPVLFLDSAQILSVDSLRFLIQLSQQKQDEEPYINIVLFATDEVSELLQSPELRIFREFIHINTLNRFDKEGVSGFLRHKMAVAGYDRESPFTPRIIESIFNDSKGLPEKINFFANKFLTSSGKAENYILPDSEAQDFSSQTSDAPVFDQNTEQDLSQNQEYDLEQNTAPETNKGFEFNLDDVDAMGATEQRDNENLMDSFGDDVLGDNRTDRAAEQLNRLAEKFEEIEQLGEQEVDSFTSDRNNEGIQKSIEQDYRSIDSDEQSENNLNSDISFDDEEQPSALPKYIIPIAVMGILFVAFLVVNSVFDSSEELEQKEAAKEQIELLPLELPPQGLLTQSEETNTSTASSPIKENTSNTSTGEEPSVTEGLSLAEGSIPVEDSIP